MHVMCGEHVKDDWVLGGAGDRVRMHGGGDGRRAGSAGFECVMGV